MHGFEVVKRSYGPIWVPVKQGVSLYMGQIVMGGICGAGYGMAAFPTATGAGGITNDEVPFGVVVGMNDAARTYSSTYAEEYTTGVQSQANQIARRTTPKFSGVEGYIKSDPMPYVQVEVLTPDTILRGRIFDSASARTALTKKANTTQSTTGARVTTAAVGNTPLAYNATVYFTNGKNAGLYRGLTSTSTTQHDLDTYAPEDIETTDYVKYVMLMLGTVKGQLSTYGQWLVAEPDYSSNYYWLDVLELHLDKDGEEYAVFKFNPVCYLGVR